MLGWYRKALGVLVGLIVLEVLLGYVYWVFAEVQGPLLPAPQSIEPWSTVTHTDQRVGGASVIAVEEATYGLDYTYRLDSQYQYSYADLILAFDTLEGAERLVDFSEYSSVAFKVKCTHENLLSFNFRLFEPNHTSANNYSSYRVATAWFSCSNEWTSVEINFSELRTPVWWSDANNIPLSSQSFQLNQILAITFGGERRGPVDIETNVKIIDLTLVGGRWPYAYLAAFFMLVALLGGAYWLRVLYRNKERAETGSGAMASVNYQPVTMESRKEREKAQVLRYIATEYANPELSLDTLVSALGINRTKVNVILKEAVGLTLSAYLNQLRLAEASRLLTENDSANVAEIAYSVGYKSISYFNKLFKETYGCTPKSFQAKSS